MASAEAEAYLKKHNAAMFWAIANRALIARRFLESINAKGERLADICHNSVVPVNGQWLHRKGAAPTGEGAVLIPGSRGSFSYIVEPVGDQTQNCYSLAHGAGRKYHRGDSRLRFRQKFSVKDLQQTVMGNKVICEEQKAFHDNRHPSQNHSLKEEAEKVVEILKEELQAFDFIESVDLGLYHRNRFIIKIEISKEADFETVFKELPWLYKGFEVKLSQAE